MHWADPGTLALLHYVVRGLTRRRCLFLLTYRADEAGDELRELLSALQRAETLTPVELAGLEAAGWRILLRRCSMVRFRRHCGKCWYAGPAASRFLCGPSSCG